MAKGKGISNTSRTLEFIRSQGWEADKVERWIPFFRKEGQENLLGDKTGPRGVRKDLFGIIDIVALGEVRGTIYIQSCGQAFAEHDRKLLESPMALKILKKGNHLMLIGWRKVKLKRGGKALRWQPRIKQYSVIDFLGV